MSNSIINFLYAKYNNEAMIKYNKDSNLDIQTKSVLHRLSISIETLRFPLIVFIIFLHCYTSTNAVTRGHDTYFRLIYPLSLWIGETGVPAFFFISGLLLFYSKKTYVQKIKSRLRTLLIPYLFFNGMILLAFLFSMYLGNSVIIAGKDLADYTLIDYIRAFWDRGVWDHGNGSPMLCPLWYIRNLMILVLISPMLYLIIKYTRLLFPVFFGLLWINAHDSAYTLQSLTMFSLGAYFPICDRSPIRIYEDYKLMFVSAFILLAVIDYLHLYISIPFALPIHRLSLVANVFFCISILGEFMYRHHLYSSFLSKSAFFVFCIHYPFVTNLRPIFTMANGQSDIILVLIYLGAVVCVTLLCVLVFMLLKRIMPGFMNVVTGNRG